MRVGHSFFPFEVASDWWDFRSLLDFILPGRSWWTPITVHRDGILLFCRANPLHECHIKTSRSLVVTLSYEKFITPSQHQPVVSLAGLELEGPLHASGKRNEDVPPTAGRLQYRLPPCHSPTRSVAADGLAGSHPCDCGIATGLAARRWFVATGRLDCTRISDARPLSDCSYRRPVDL
jgi:hypothetical protein